MSGSTNAGVRTLAAAASQASKQFRKLAFFAA